MLGQPVFQGRRVASWHERMVCAQQELACQCWWRRAFDPYADVTCESHEKKERKEKALERAFHGGGFTTAVPRQQYCSVAVVVVVVVV